MQKESKAKQNKTEAIKQQKKQTKKKAQIL